MAAECPNCAFPLQRRPKRALGLKGDGDALWCAACNGKWDCTAADGGDNGEDHDDDHEETGEAYGQADL